MYSTESIPKAIVSVHISVVYLPVIRAVINRCLILIELIEFTRKQEREVGGRSFAEVSAAAKKVWDEQMGRIKVEGGTEEQQKTFYSCLYRTLLFPQRNVLPPHGPDSSVPVRD